MSKVTMGVSAGLVIYLFAAAIGAGAEPLPFKTAIISYSLSGTQSGTETVYINVAANKIAVEKSVTTTLGGVTDSDNTLDIYDGKTLYSVNLDKRSAVKAVKEGNIISEMFGEGMCADYYKGKELFLNKQCKVYQFPQGTAYFWHGILFKQDISMGTEIRLKKEATDISLNVPLPKEKFKLPHGAKVTDAQKMMKALEEEFKRK